MSGKIIQVSRLRVMDKHSVRVPFEEFVYIDKSTRTISTRVITSEQEMGTASNIWSHVLPGVSWET